MHHQSHVVYRLGIHLPDRQRVTFSGGNVHSAVENVKDKKLMGFLNLNRHITAANQYLYTEIPLHFV